MNSLNSRYKYIFAVISVVALLYLLMSIFGKNEKVKLDNELKTENLKVIEENISSEDPSIIKPDMNLLEKNITEKEEEKTLKKKVLTNKQKVEENNEVKETKINKILDKTKPKTSNIIFDDPMLTVNELHRGLSEINFKNRSRSLNQIKSLVKRTYNSRKMTSMIIGKKWKNIKDEKKIELIEVMEEYIASNYIARFSKLNNINFQKENVRQIKNGFKIVSTVLKLKKDDVNIDYLLSKNDGEWKIFDVLLDNSVSEVATKKSEFSNFISGENIDKLISALKKKNNQLKIE